MACGCVSAIFGQTIPNFPSSAQCPQEFKPAIASDNAPTVQEPNASFATILIIKGIVVVVCIFLNCVEQ